ncbi:glycosyltransferase [Haloferula sargassicola]|uniref:D-inositol-3-phosphate glycosyltransferase n=1 Tax=Haloferula sargassicola TaxID=490096 RepID=A0ABP9UQR9_9BACT
MKVLFFIESLRLSAGGTSLEVFTMAERLAHETDVSVSVLTLATQEPSHQLSDKVTHITLPRPSGVLGWPGAWRMMKKIFERQEVVFLTGIWGPYDGLGMRYAWPHRARVFVRICGMLEPYILKRNRWKKRLALRCYVRRNLAVASGLITNSLPEQNWVRGLGFNHNILRIPNGVERPTGDCQSRASARDAFGFQADHFVLLYLGRIHPKKGLALLLDSIAEMGEVVRSKVHLLVAGRFSDQDYRRTIETRVGDLSLARNVTFIGEVEGSGKESAFASADCFVLPSESEGLPNAVLEALARRLPVIVTEGCNMPEVELERAGKVIARNKESLAAAIEMFIEMGESIEDYRQQAGMLSETCFSLDRTVDSYKEVIFGKAAS